MRILMINKFLHPNGGSETYIFKLGAYLESNFLVWSTKTAV